MIKIEISGGSAEEISTHISQLANLMSGTSLPAVAAAAASEPKPTTRRSRKADAAPETPAETPAADEAKVDEASKEVSEPDAPADEAAPEEPAADEQADEAGTEEPAGDAPTSENHELFKGFDTSKARDWIISNYLNPCFKNPQDRTQAFREIVQHFGSDALSKIPADKLVDVLLYVEEKISEAKK